MNILKFENCISFKIGENEYVLYFRDVLDYVQDCYKPDIIIDDIDGLLNCVIDYANNGDILDLILLFKYIDNDITNYEYIIIDNGLCCWRFNDLKDLSNIFNIEDIVQDMVNKKLVGDYCTKI